MSDMSTSYGFTKKYLTKDEKPWFPVMGEIHFSRYRAELWEESLRKMKAGGLSIASVYVIWIHHEEEEGKFDFTGRRNLRGFLEAAKKVGISVFLRIGPWVHGEARNGGFPDWLQAKHDTIDLRSNDPAYLSYVRRFWEQVYEQAKGLLYKDGGPVIGTQIENEYGHVGGYRGEKGEQHMRTLAAMAREIGFDLPLYTATGWGGAVTGGLLPVMGGYCEAPWDQSITEIAPNSNYIFSHIRNDSLIASDHHVDDTVTFNQDDFPYLTAELGGGLQVTQHRRPIATGPDVGAMSLTKLGSGVGMLGYYMYHGGSNPDSKLSTLQESRATGYLNDLPEINYDFNAPIRQYGTISDTYREIRLLAYFLQDFGADLAVLPADIDPEFVKPGDSHTLRLSTRHDDTHGYIFVNNYQRRHIMDAHENVVLEGKTAGVPVRFPATNIAPGEYAFYPYNMKLGESTLVSALATPLCKLLCNVSDKNDICEEERAKRENVYVFYGDKEPQFTWDGTPAKVLMLSRVQALSAAKVTLNGNKNETAVKAETEKEAEGQEYLVLADDFVWEEDGALKVVGGKETVIRTFPKLSAEVVPEDFKEIGTEGEFTVYKREMSADAAMTGKEGTEKNMINTQTSVYFAQSAQTPKKLSGKLVNSCGQPEIFNGDEKIYEISVQYGRKSKVQKDGIQSDHLAGKDRIAGYDCILTFDYACENMNLYVNGRKVNDYFYTGQKAVFSLGYFDFPTQIIAVLRPLHEGDHIYLQEWPRMEEGSACRIDAITIEEKFK